MAKEINYEHPGNTPHSVNLIKRIKEMLDVSGLEMSRALGVYHPQTWDYLMKGAAIKPYIVERIITHLSVEQLTILRAELIAERIEQMNLERFGSTK